jgi:hypothetical protein
MMAQKIEMVMVDDLNGEPAAETVRFGLDGRHYELDLTKENANRLRAELEAHVRGARAVAPPALTQNAAQIRAWAKENGYAVAGRGRLHHDVVEAYHRAL